MTLTGKEQRRGGYSTDASAKKMRKQIFTRESEIEKYSDDIVSSNEEESAEDEIVSLPEKSP